MKEHQFKRLNPEVVVNGKLRDPQREGYAAIEAHFKTQDSDREVGLVLPVGCGKSGLITIAPFAVDAKRVLVIAPGLRIAGQLLKDFDPANPSMFYRKCEIISDSNFPEPAEIRGRATNQADLEEA